MSSTPPPSPEHFDRVSLEGGGARRRQRGFHDLLARVFRYRIPEGDSVLELGCGQGELLARLQPAVGKGVDFSPAMVAAARERFGERFEFEVGDAAAFCDGRTYDHIVADYLVGYVPDIQVVLENARRSSKARTRLHVASLNALWKPLLRMGQWLGIVNEQPLSNWISGTDLRNLLELSGWEVVREGAEVLLPWDIPLLSGFCNRFLVRLPFFRNFGSTLVFEARPRAAPVIDGDISCSVIVPMRNEAGNVGAALERIPTLGRRTEIVFVEGNSKDDTWEVLQREVAAYRGPHLLQLVKQPGKGKWDAVRKGFEVARGDVLVIQDGDLTAPPEDLPKFYDAVAGGVCEFANGSRLVYPMEKKAMRFLNLLGNKFFAMALSAVLEQPVKDSLCGTKMLLRSDWERLARRIEVLGSFDPFGDFNLLFGSSMLGLRIRDVPVRYRDRTYGDTNISRFSHGWMLLRMTAFGLRKLRFHR